MTFYVRLKTAPPAPEEATHFMVLKLGALPGAAWDALKASLNSIVTQAFSQVLNLFGGPIGWQIVGTPVLYEPGQSTPIGTVPEGQGWVFIYLQKTGSPVLPLAALAGFILSFLVRIGFVILAWAVYEMAHAQLVHAESEKEIKDTVNELYEKGEISTEELKEILEAYKEKEEEETIYDKIAKFLGITPEEARYLVIAVAVILGLAFIKSLFR